MSAMCHQTILQDTLDALISNFKRNMHPSKNLSVDETMVGFRRRFGAKQYIPTKPSKYGIKAFILADSKNGYILDILVYTGADTLPSSQNPDLPEPARVLCHLRYYTSVELVNNLEQHSTAFTGTCIFNRRHIPLEFRSGRFRLQLGEHLQKSRF